MAFEVYSPKLVCRMRPGKATINGNGQVRLHPSDLSRVGIKTQCVILIDKVTSRIGLREPHPRGDGPPDPVANVVFETPGGTGKVSLKGALNAVGVGIGEAQKKVELLISPEQRLLTLYFGVPAERGLEASKRGK